MFPERITSVIRFFFFFFDSVNDQKDTAERAKAGMQKQTSGIVKLIRAGGRTWESWKRSSEKQHSV